MYSAVGTRESVHIGEHVENTIWNSVSLDCVVYYSCKWWTIRS